MSKFLTVISRKSEIINENDSIDVDQKNLIITGGNGCGKTTLLNDIYSKLSTHLLQRNHQPKSQIENNINYFFNRKENAVKGSHEYHQANEQLRHHQAELARVWGGIQLEFEDVNKLSLLLSEGKGIIAFFRADRQASIQAATGANKIISTDESNYLSISKKELGNTFEQHLANLKTRQSFAKTHDNNLELFNSIDNWFSELEKNIAYLMEDTTFELKFNPDEFKFFLTQEGKKPYTFQTLSSGYSSIFNIISDLIMKTEAFKISPSELQGIVMIDEIDAHLHVSLQRKILPFLTKTYPSIQFIVTTHSPFVIGSLEDSIIYDLSSKQHFKDLSSYSYETIIEGLLGVPVVSVSLEKDIKRLSLLINEDNHDIEAIDEIVQKLLPYRDKLDDESAIFLIKGMNLLKCKARGDK